MTGAVTPVAGRSVELDDMTTRMIESRRTQIQQAAEAAKTRAEAPRSPEATAEAARASAAQRSEAARPATEAPKSARLDQRASQDSASGRPALSAEVRSMLQSESSGPSQSVGSEMRLIRDLLDTIRAYERDGSGRA